MKTIYLILLLSASCFSQDTPWRYVPSSVFSDSVGNVYYPDGTLFMSTDPATKICIFTFPHGTIKLRPDGSIVIKGHISQAEETLTIHDVLAAFIRGHIPKP